MAVKLIESSLSSTFGLGIETKFKDGWKETTIARPALHAVYYIDYGPGSIGRPYWLTYDAYRLALKDQLGKSVDDIEQNLFYGAFRACSFGDSKQHLTPCNYPECDVCGILTRSLILKDSDFGRGIYTTAHSSKADQDSQNIYPQSKYKAMFLVNVAVGNPKFMRGIDPILVGPPSGYQSVEAVPLSKGGTLVHPETVVYRTEAALPSVLIIYESTSGDNDDPGDTSLEMAEREIAAICKPFGRSQFFRYGTSGYKDSVRHFFESSAEVASSAVEPGSVPDLSSIMKVLAKLNPVPFAVKGGGHATNPKMSSTIGIQIYMARFNDVIYNERTQLVEVGAGCLWDHVYIELAKFGRSAVGGARMGGVGVAGYLQGGGYSLKTNQYGLGIDNIIQFQLVLPDGRFMDVSDSGPDRELFEALKGGGCNFGIIVSYTLKTHDQGRCVTSPLDFKFCPCDSDAVKDALADFAQNEKRKKAVVVGTFRHFYQEEKSWCSDIDVFCFYDGTAQDIVGNDPFQKFKDIRATKHTTDSTNKAADSTDTNDGFLETDFYSALGNLGRMYWEESDDNLNCPCTKDEIGTLAIDSPAYDATSGAPMPAMQGVGETPRGRFACIMVTGFNRALIDEMQKQAAISADEMPKHGGIRILIDVWPFLPSIFDQSPPAAWPHKKGEAVSPLLAWYNWQEGKGNDRFWIGEMERALKEIRDVAKQQGFTRKKAPVYLNTSLLKIKVDKIYRGNLENLGRLRSKFDPDNVMGNAGGFKIPLR